jgi:hypothetical protein
MDCKHTVTAREMRRILLRRKGVSEWVARHGSEIPPGVHTSQAMLRQFRAQLDARRERGIVNLSSNTVLLPRNPFEPTRRRLPKPEIAAIGSLALLLAGAVIWFNQS